MFDYKLQPQYQSQLMMASDLLGDINREISGLTKEELGELMKTPEYLQAKTVYENGFLSFLSDKFSAEYAATDGGREAAAGLLKAIKESKDKITAQAKVREEKINKILELLDTDPEMKKRYDELTVHGKQ